MNIRFKGYVTKDYEIELSPHNGRYYGEEMEFDFMRHINGNDLPDEAESFFLNYVYIKDDKLFANATVKHWFEEEAEGKDIDYAEAKLLDWGYVITDVNKDHKGRFLIDIEEHEYI